MKFRIEINWLIRTEEDMELDPKDFLHCSNIEELNDEISDYIHQHMEYLPIDKNYKKIFDEEALGVRYWDTTYGQFMLEWQKLKGLPEEL